MNNTKTNNQNKHIPVLLDQVLSTLSPKKGESYLDLTAGYGGHAAAIIGRTLQANKAVLIDRDQHAVAHLTNTFKQPVTIMHNDFFQASQKLLEKGATFDMILADLGVSSPHLDNASRGFSIRLDGPLDMRMDERQQTTAADIVNTYSEADLTTVIREFGEEPRARKVARLIVEHRPFTTTHELAQTVAKAWPGRSKSHPATRTFQALRLAVNRELDLLARALPIWIDLLSPHGRLAVISFHSLEDRIVKQSLVEQAGDRYDARIRLLTKQPLTATAEELVFNPRARSAKLRAAVKINI